MRECFTCSRCFPESSSVCPADNSELTTTLAGEPLLEGRYELQRRLGRGGMGVVFQARHLFLKTQHAVKVILPELAVGDPEFLTRFRQEAMAAAAIRHPNVIAVTDFGVINGSMPFLVMEFIRGESLHDLLLRRKRLAPGQALEIMEPIVAGVAAAHCRGIVHRDLKPLNIMIEDDLPMHEAVKVLDFGLAKIKSGELLGSFVAAQTQGMMGSPYYMAPEQWDGEIDARTDIYSLGVILYQMLAGDVPFAGPNLTTIMKKHVMEAPPSFATQRAAVPPAVEEVVRHALAKRPEGRPATALDFINELRAAVETGEPTASLIRTARRVARPTAEQFARTFLTDDATTPSYAEADTLYEERRDEAKGAEHTRALSSRETSGAGEDIHEDSRVTLVAPAGAAAGTREMPKARPAVEAGEDSATAAAPSRRPAIRVSTAAPEVLKRPLPWLLAGGAAAVLIFAAAMLMVRSPSGNDNRQSTLPTAPAPVAPAPPPDPNRILIAGGTFQMGRGDLPANPHSLKAGDWLVMQWPLHDVTVKSFYIDRTEVTNAEYAEFVASAGYPAPKGGPSRFWTPWDGATPPAGQEQLPVRNVSYHDAQAFAAWRSQRDRSSYRLPTEEEWEYAARSRGKAHPYPWGDKWENNQANVDTREIRPVGSHPRGQTEQGVEDMLGNVWEWTSSTASVYKGNQYMQVPRGQKSHIVIRGGSCESEVLGDEPLTTTSRVWVAPKDKRPLLGFRLVREAPEQ